MSLAETENTIHNKGKKLKTKNDGLTAVVERKVLQPLQRSADDMSLTRPREQAGNKGGKDGTKALTSKKARSVFEETEQRTEKEMAKPAEGTNAASIQSGSNGTECTCHCHKRTEEERMYEYITAVPTLEEWKKLAEERQMGLEETLVENRQLHFEVIEMRNQMNSLSRELEEVKEQRDYFAGVLQKVLSDDGDEELSSTAEPDPVSSESCCTSDVTESP